LEILPRVLLVGSKPMSQTRNCHSQSSTWSLPFSKHCSIARSSLNLKKVKKKLCGVETPPTNRLPAPRDNEWIWPTTDQLAAGWTARTGTEVPEFKQMLKALWH
jgi:hypothetical protein